LLEFTSKEEFQIFCKRFEMEYINEPVP